MNTEEELQRTIAQMVQPGKGILAADESLPTIGKRFAAVGVDNTEENRRGYRALMCGAPGIGEFLSGVILFEETLEQTTDDGTPLPVVLARQGVVPGVKVDKGKGPLPGAPGDRITYGLDGLAERLVRYREQGARFAKWREVYPVGERNPTPLGVEANAEMLARYAAVCQQEGFVPIVEPEVLIDGDHTLERCAEVSEAVLHAVFHALHRHRVTLEYLVLKPSMVIPGKEHPQKASPEQVAEATVRVLRRTVPAAVPGINFLSGGQGPEEATANLNAMNAAFPGRPWELSFSFARALQEPVMAAWAGRARNVDAAQRVFLHRLRMNGAARRGEYRPDLEARP
ncbi:fructose-bisphosphate aldolase class 1 [bacterium BMS3Bbin12]|nr:fructose-bisphosphate aldolase class 1 [bacterium BMS3Abin12]GBE48033.1 fructose-bisphosphate aldolase class 1 [bacterium BMS3Bbin12]GBE51338.1 fructose-bisphosphate aldolase class 1 [bacterium BMS3Bbin13]HDJ85840.1 fructose-bisphosphate aldolase class I [Chromatiales bacterium]